MREILIDFSNLCWQCYYAAKCDKQEFLSLLGRKVNEFGERFVVPNNSIILVKDNRALSKYQLYPEYKAGRKVPEYDPRPDGEELLMNMGCRSVISPDNEADDVICTLVYREYFRQDLVIIITGDHDLWQLWEIKNVAIFNPIKMEYVKQEDIQKSFQSYSKHIPLIKALWGDVSDNIPNVVPRMQKQLLPLIKQTDGDLTEFLSLCASNRGKLSNRCWQLITSNFKNIERNFQLVKLKRDCALVWNDIDGKG